MSNSYAFHIKLGVLFPLV